MLGVQRRRVSEASAGKRSCVCPAYLSHLASRWAIGKIAKRPGIPLQNYDKNRGTRRLSTLLKPAMPYCVAHNLSPARELQFFEESRFIRLHSLDANI